MDETKRLIDLWLTSDDFSGDVDQIDLSAVAQEIYDHDILRKYQETLKHKREFMAALKADVFR